MERKGEGRQRYLEEAIVAIQVKKIMLKQNSFNLEPKQLNHPRQEAT